MGWTILRHLGVWLLIAWPAWVLAADPLDSPSWEDLRKRYFAGQAVVFDEAVKVVAPVTAEDPLNVPIGVDASRLEDVREVQVLADLNPIVEILSFEPGTADPRLGFRIKLQQSSPVRAAARTGDGVWHVGGTWVNTTGGGCTLPSTGSASPDWQRRLNEVSGRIWHNVEAAPGQRVRIRIVHPMDTGLAAGNPAFYIQDLRIADDAGHTLMQIQGHEPVSENPLFTLDLPAGLANLARVKVTGRDNNGNRIDAWVTP
ncbi:MAG: quinoprotein dehydrogenase-associated SoxYZ-like carrier [Zoogloeaceae bacterium]|nr:quinoprotein dehydrogenase-associated SoxYZ-like carrier [Zoogloeaceae bacterium]